MNEPLAVPEPATIPGGTASDRCAPLWHEAHRAAAGTAPVARFWVAIEQPGPWGRKALTESHLDPAIGRRLDDACSAAGGRAVLVRRPGVHADAESSPRALFVTAVSDGVPRLGRRDVAASEVPAAVDELAGALDEVTAGRLPAGFTEVDGVLLVCSNGKRDRCCAIEARPLLRDLAAAGERVWEATHLNGHRFAPTAVALPTGQMTAWLDADAARALLAAVRAHELWTGGVHERGVCRWPQGVQAVDAHLRTELGERRPDALGYEWDADLLDANAADLVGRTAQVVARHSDGRSWTFRLDAVGRDALPESCGKEAVPGADWVVQEA